MINSVWYRGLGQLTTPCIWKAIHDIFQSPDDSVHLPEINDDLIGFFNSVPRDAIQDALDALISDFQQLPWPLPDPVSYTHLRAHET